LLSALECLGIEIKLLALKNITITSATLARAGSNASKETAACERIIKSGVERASLLSVV
jgi:hypothetical protein